MTDLNQLIIKLQNELNITSIAVTHDMNSAYKIADRIIMLDQGRVIADGGPNQFRSNADQHVQRFIRGQSVDLENKEINSPDN